MNKIRTEGTITILELLQTLRANDAALLKLRPGGRANPPRKKQAA